MLEQWFDWSGNYARGELLVGVYAVYKNRMKQVKSNQCTYRLVQLEVKSSWIIREQWVGVVCRVGTTINSSVLRDMQIIVNDNNGLRTPLVRKL